MLVGILARQWMFLWELGTAKPISCTAGVTVGVYLPGVVMWLWSLCDFMSWDVAWGPATVTVLRLFALNVFRMLCASLSLLTCRRLS